MLAYQPDLFVVSRMDAASDARALPGFSAHLAYRVLGVYRPAETGACYFILADDQGLLQFVNAEAWRAHGILPGTPALRLPARFPEGEPSGDGSPHPYGPEAPVLAQGPARTGWANAL